MTFRKNQNQSSIQSPKFQLKKNSKQSVKASDEEKKKRGRKVKSRRDDRKNNKLNHSIKNSSFYPQFTQESYKGKKNGN